LIEASVGGVISTVYSKNDLGTCGKSYKTFFGATTFGITTLRIMAISINDIKYREH
jgi:hypothetical protein